MGSEEEKNSLENTDFTNRNIRLNSPRSIEALRSLGYEPEKLYKISLREFLKNYPDVRNMHPEIQMKRYNHKEELKRTKIKEAIERRKDIIENPSKVYPKAKIFDSKFAKTKVDDEKKLEKMKNKGLQQLQSLIDKE